MASAGTLFYDLVPKIDSGALAAEAKKGATAAGSVMGKTLGTEAGRAAGPALAGSARTMEQAAGDMGTRVGSAIGRSFAPALAPVGSAITWAQGQFRRLPPVVQETVGGIPDVVRNAMGFLESSVSDATEKTESAFAAMGEKIKGAWESIKEGAPAAGLALGALAVGAVTAGVQFDIIKENSTVAFTTMLGSADKAQTMIANLADFAKKTPFDFPGLVQSAQHLMAFGFSADKTIPTLTAIGDAVAGLGGSAAEVDRVTTALGQMMAKGKVQGDEILQLTEAGIPALRILANEYGVTTATMSDMITKGQVASDKAIPLLLKGIEAGTKGAAGETMAFAGMMAAQSTTLTGVWSNFSDSFQSTMGDLVAPVIPMVKDGLGILTNLFMGIPAALVSIGDVFAPIMANLGAAFSDLGVALGPIIEIFLKPLALIVGVVLVGAWRAFIAVLTVVSSVFAAVAGFLREHQFILLLVVTAVLAYTGAIIAQSAWLVAWYAILTTGRVVMAAITVAQWLWNAAITANPIGLIVAAIALLVAGLIYAWQNSETFRNVVIGAWEGIKTVIAVVWQFIQDVFNGFVAKAQATGALFAAAWTGIGIWWANLWGGVRDIAITVWTSIRDFFVTIWNWIVNLVSTVWGAITDYFVRFFNYHHDLIVGVWTAITGFLSAVWNGISALAIAIWTPIHDFFVSIWTGVQTTAITIWTALSGWFAARWAELSALWNLIWTAVSTYFITVWTNIQNTAIVIWTAIAGWFAARWAELSALWNTVWTAISTFFSRIWAGIQGTGISIWSAISGWFGARWAELSALWNTVWDSVSKKFSDIWAGIQNVASTVWNSIVGAVKAGVNKVIDAINWLTGAGGKSGINVVLDFFLIPLIPRIPRLAAGGTVGDGFTTNGPVAIVGEGNRAHPEYVIPTDPAHRKNALALYESLGAQLLAGGGILGGIGDAAKWIGGGVSGMVDAAVSYVRDAVGGGGIGDIAVKAVTRIVEAAEKKIQQLWDAMLAAQAATAGAGVGGKMAGEFGGGNISPGGAMGWIIQHESGGNPTAQNPHSTASGLFQMINGTWKAYGGSTPTAKQASVAEQTAVATRYVNARYGGWGGAQAYWMAHGNYDQGGILPPGMSTAYNGTGRPELILTQEQAQALGSGGSLIGSLAIQVPERATAQDVVDELSFALRHARHGGLHARRYG